MSKMKSLFTLWRCNEMLSLFRAQHACYSYPSRLMGACLSKAGQIEEQKKDKTEPRKQSRKGETEKKGNQPLPTPPDSETGEEQQVSCSLKGERLCQPPLPYHSVGVNDYKKFATGKYILGCQQLGEHHYSYGPSSSEYHTRNNPTRFYNWHAENTNNAWKNGYRSRGQGASRGIQERNFYASGPADTYRVPRRPRGYHYERQRAAEEKRVRVAPKVTPFLGEDEPIYGRIGVRIEKTKEGERSEDKETADILRAAAQMFENNGL